MRVADPVGEQRGLRARVSLVRAIDRGSVVLPSRLAEAFLNVSRHLFVPVFYRREGERFVPWRIGDGDAEAWIDAVYEDDSLITEVDGVHAEEAAPGGLTGVPTSSSTAPGLMADMLDALDVSEGHEVVEIGAGSGYNAALLCRLAGDRRVTTVDRSGKLADKARERLGAAGFRPRVITGDGARGVPDGARYDRLIATASVPRVPPVWLERCRPGGLLVIPLKGTLAGGALARLTKLADGTAAGRLLHTPAAFMPLRSGQDTTQRPARPVDGTCRETPLSGRELDDWTFSFFAQLHLGPRVVREYGRKGGLHVTTVHDPGDGSVARVEDRSGGCAAVTTAGPRDLWASVEDAHVRWRELHRPRREWFTVEVTPGEQVVTYQAPGGAVHRWSL